MEGKDDDLVFLGTIIHPPPEIKRLKKGAASSWQLAALTDTELQVSGEPQGRSSLAFLSLPLVQL